MESQVELTRYLEAEFSTENIRAYAEACRATAWNMLELIMDRGGEPITVLIPSRGAVPFIIGAIKALKEDPEISSFVEDAFGTTDIVETPPVSCFNSEKAMDNKNPLIRILLLPFTADASISDEAVNSSEVVSDMRRFMTRVACEILYKEPNEREAREFNLYLKFLEEVEGRKGFVDFYRKFEPVKKGEPVLYIDTVISGRASHTIIEEFQAQLNPLGRTMGFQSTNDLVPLLVVDQYGQRLKTSFRRYIDSLLGTNSIVKVPKILSEDRGAALLGITAVIYESLITEAAKSGRLCGDLIPAFGAWHDVPEKEAEIHNSIFNEFINLVTQKITGEDDNFDEDRRKFLTTLQESRVLEISDQLSPSEVSEFVRSGIPIEHARETSSHIVQIEFPKGTSAKIIEKICPLE